MRDALSTYELPLLKKELVLIRSDSSARQRQSATSRGDSDQWRLVRRPYYSSMPEYAIVYSCRRPATDLEMSIKDEATKPWWRRSVLGRILLPLQGNRRSSLLLLTSALLLVLVWLNGWFTTGESKSNRTMIRDERCTSAATSLVSAGINLLALDFDLTIVDLHTGGQREGMPKSLQKHVRPAFTCLLHAAINEKINVAVVTFSEQEELISDVMKRTFGTHIPVRGWFDEMGGKQKHMARVTEDIISQVQGDVKINERTTLLIDDDERNIKIAKQNDFLTILFDPDNPWQLLESINLL